LSAHVQFSVSRWQVVATKIQTDPDSAGNP
jgi:hypothetical protein